MSALADAARDYLRLRNSLGHDLAEYHRELPRLVAFLEAEGLPTVTVAAALAWAQGPGVDPATSIPPRRMTIARGFARYLAGIDARTEVPPPGLIAGRRRWRPPFIYSPGDIEALMAQARQLTPMPAATHETLIGLLAVTGKACGSAKRSGSTALTSTGPTACWRSGSRSSARPAWCPSWAPPSTCSTITPASAAGSARRPPRRASSSPPPAPG